MELAAKVNSTKGGRPYKLMEHPRFRAAYDFLLLRAESGEESKELADWWTKFQEVDADEKTKMTQGNSNSKSRRPRRRTPASSKPPQRHDPQ